MHVVAPPLSLAWLPVPQIALAGTLCTELLSLGLLEALGSEVWGSSHSFPFFPAEDVCGSTVLQNKTTPGIFRTSVTFSFFPQILQMVTMLWEKTESCDYIVWGLEVGKVGERERRLERGYLFALESLCAFWSVKTSELCILLLGKWRCEKPPYVFYLRFNFLISPSSPPIHSSPAETWHCLNSCLKLLSPRIPAQTLLAFLKIGTVAAPDFLHHPLPWLLSHELRVFLPPSWWFIFCFLDRLLFLSCLLNVGAPWASVLGCLRLPHGLPGRLIPPVTHPHAPDVQIWSPELAEVQLAAYSHSAQMSLRPQKSMSLEPNSTSPTLLCCLSSWSLQHPVSHGGSWGSISLTSPISIYSPGPASCRSV